MGKTLMFITQDISNKSLLSGSKRPARPSRSGQRLMAIEPTSLTPQSTRAQICPCTTVLGATVLAVWRALLHPLVLPLQQTQSHKNMAFETHHHITVLSLHLPIALPKGPARTRT